MFTALMIVAGVVLGAAGFYAYLHFYFLPRFREKVLWEHESVKVAALKGGETFGKIKDTPMCRPITKFGDVKAPRELTMQEAVQRELTMQEAVQMANEATRRAERERREVAAKYAEEEGGCLCDVDGNFKCDCCNGKEMP